MVIVIKIMLLTVQQTVNITVTQSINFMSNSLHSSKLNYYYMLYSIFYKIISAMINLDSSGILHASIFSCNNNNYLLYSGQHKSSDL